MSHLIDTNVAIYLRDQDREIIIRLFALDDAPKLSIISLVELEGGVVAKPDLATVRRKNLDTLLAKVVVAQFDRAVVEEYRGIVEAIGFSRRRILDRLIAATAIANDLTLITTNGVDFRDIPGLKLEVWPTPAQ
ncbi:PIN domain-containing protein [Sphingomonas sp. SUN019]|uniref:PIN domain-containing protein n=1 Tax=Sphingomonas sp. SUN019 TaxID=2937788 RepID=UPI002164D546|nr:PIN domain-containing protein [Sphingomonas sp. SUN019]UVO51916.1 PIN domain-containing protein [Sphingomonas sp. SUN019]